MKDINNIGFQLTLNKYAQGSISQMNFSIIFKIQQKKGFSVIP